jgi:hypothetical protein
MSVVQAGKGGVMAVHAFGRLKEAKLNLTRFIKYKRQQFP